MASKNNLWYLTVFFAEFFASAFLLFIGCLGSVDQSSFFEPSMVTISLVWGIAVMIGINSFGAVSGGFMTPMITLSAFLQNVIDLQTALIYFAAQMLGSYFGYALLRMAIPTSYLSSPSEFCLIQTNLPMASSFLIEFVACFIFVTFLGSAMDRRNAKLQDSMPLKFGFMVLILVLTAGPLTGAGLNPARAFAPAVFNLNWNQHWLYWAAPISATISSTLLYKHVFARDYSKQSEEDLSIEEIDIVNKK